MLNYERNSKLNLVIMTHNWYIVQFKRNSHRVATRNLSQQGFKTFLPLQTSARKNRTKFATNIEPLFPGYMFLSIDLGNEPWHKINSTLGVSRLICQDGIPMKVPEEIVSALMSRCDSSGKLLPPETLASGASVKILSGALANFIATVEKFDSEKRIWVLMEIMGQVTRVQVALDQIKLQN